MNLPHTVTIVTAAVGADRSGDETLDFGNAASRVQVAGWMQQQSSAETLSAGRDQRVTRWRLFTDSTPDLSALQRVEWGGDQYVISGRPNHLETPRGYHHTETDLELVEG